MQSKLELHNVSSERESTQLKRTSTNCRSDEEREDHDCASFAELRQMLQLLVAGLDNLFGKRFLPGVVLDQFDVLNQLRQQFDACIGRLLRDHASNTQLLAVYEINGEQDDHDAQSDQREGTDL